MNARHSAAIKPCYHNITRDNADETPKQMEIRTDKQPNRLRLIPIKPNSQLSSFEDPLVCLTQVGCTSEPNTLTSQQLPSAHGMQGPKRISRYGYEPAVRGFLA